MTVSDIVVCYDLVQELISQGVGCSSVWEYRHTMTKKVLYAVFPNEQYCDIHESPYVERPVRIYNGKTWLGTYEYLNHVDEG